MQDLKKEFCETELSIEDESIRDVDIRQCSVSDVNDSRSTVPSGSTPRPL